MNYNQKLRTKNYNAFSLIELLVYISIFAVVAGLMTSILTTVLKVNQRESASVETSEQLSFVMQTVSRLVRESSNIEIATSSASSALKLKLRMKDSAKDPTCVYLESQAIKIAEGPDAVNAQNCNFNASSSLTSSNVIADKLDFSTINSYPGHDVVSVDIQLTYNSQNPQSQTTRNLKSAIARVSAATFDSNLLPGSDNQYEIGFSGNNRWKNIYLSGGINDSIYFSGSNVGIGLTTPTARLYVQQVTSTTMPAGRFEAATPGFIGTSLLADNTLGDSSAYNLFAARTDSDADVGGPFTKFLIRGDGNVGIGTVTPGAKLQVSGGNIFIDDSGTSTPWGFYNPDYNGYVANHNIEFGFRGWGSMLAGMRAGTLDVNDTGHKIAFYTHAGAGVFERMRIDKNGNVGIGDTSPAALLTVGAGDAFQVNSSGLITTASVGTAALKTALGSASGSVTTDITMNDYAFFPDIRQTPDTGRTVWPYSYSTEPDNILGRFRITGVSGTWTVKWRYITASDRPTIWVIADDGGSIATVWEAEDPINQYEWPENPNPFGGTELQENQYFLSPEPLTINQLKALYGKFSSEIQDKSLSEFFDYIISRGWLNSISGLDDISLIAERYQPAAREWALRFLAKANKIDVATAIRVFLRADNKSLVVADNPQQNLIDYKNNIEQVRVTSESLNSQN